MYIKFEIKSFIVSNILNKRSTRARKLKKGFADGQTEGLTDWGLITI
jgi:hypothetical protein